MSKEESLSELCSKVVEVLENPSYKWRTLSALVREIGLPEHEVLEVLQRCGTEIVRSNSADGELIFTTRRHLRENSSVVERLSRALRNRGA